MLKERKRFTRALVAFVFVSAIGAVPAAADETQETILRDDALLATHDDALRERTLDELDALGVDTIHTLALWRRFAPDPQSFDKPSFDASDPAAYPAANWDYLDALVRGADARGISLILSPSGTAPFWATGCDENEATESERPGACKPSVREYQRFVIALARRYSGTYDDENGGVLPRVSRWSVWNEPNQAGWLYPQWERKRGEWAPTAAYRYRRLFEAAARGLRKNGHADSQILIGETAPLGRRGGSWAKRSIAPAEFWRAVLCIDERGNALRGDAARNLGCSGFDELDADGIAHHPYTRGAGGDPRSRQSDPDDATLAYNRRLRTVFDRGARLDRNHYSLDFYLTEYGFQTDPPDYRSGVRPSLAAKWMNESNWIAYNNGRIKAFGNYQLIDERPVESFQTGLRYAWGDPKPSYAAFQVPVWVVEERRYRRVWGQVRPAQVGQTVEIQYSVGRTPSWKRLRTITIENAARYIDVKTSKRARKFRLVWKSPSGDSLISRDAFPEDR